MLFCVVSTPIAAQTIVVLGDSISAGYGLKNGSGWVRLLEQRILQKNKNFSVYNESISGDTSAGGLARIDTILKRYQPNLLLLQLGANDGLRGLSLKKMKQNLKQIIRQSKLNNTSVLLLSMRIPPNYGKRYVDAFYQVYSDLAAEVGIPMVPFIMEDVALIKELMQKDGLHPNEKAQSLIADKIWQYLESVLEL